MGGHTEAEIASQPECWERAAGLDPAGLPAPGERVAVLGCGTSWFVGQSYAALREAAGHGETDAFAASEAPTRRYDRVLALSRSGTTTEVLDALDRLPTGTPTVALVADAGSPIGRHTGHTVELAFADEASVVQTRFATTALTLLRAHLGLDVARSVADARRALADPLPDRLAGAEQLTFLGQGWAYGLAREAALKLREAAGAWTEAYPAMEYRHGPIAVAGPGRVVWFLGAAPAGLAGQAAATGGTVVDDDLDPLADLVRVQRLAVAVARRRSLDPDAPRHLGRSVILGPPRA